MKTRSVAAHLDPVTLDTFRSVVGTENRTPSQVIGVALRSLIELSPGARRAAFAIDGIADESERAYAAKLIGRAALKAYDAILDGRRHDLGPDARSNGGTDTEEAIEAEAVRMCRP